MARIAFFGTPDFAATILRAIDQLCLQSHHSLELVVCQPDRAANRGMKSVTSPVKEYALSRSLKVYQPSTLKKGSPDGEEFFSLIMEENPDICIVAAYGKMIPTRFLELPKYGYINVHASLLPRWRGASPIQHAIWHGDQESGVTLIKLTAELDAGPVYSMATIAIGIGDTALELTQALAKLGSSLLVETLPKIFDGSCLAVEQSSAGVTYAPVLSKKHGEISWDQSSDRVLKQILAMQPWPRAYTFYRGKRIFFFGGTQVEHNCSTTRPGCIIAIDGRLVVATQDGAVAFQEMQLEGKNRMKVDQFIKGCTIEQGSFFDKAL